MLLYYGKKMKQFQPDHLKGPSANTQMSFPKKRIIIVFYSGTTLLKNN